ncbi:polyamine ABC transporter ATP-binding protein [candidate division KSB3 bacterium]|uniref:Spermidine/putrescine import ATP-binding protein PotA n=1 Tax=candidate division KSB3 bacterium TaxID=2044937 RepID=A0A9D5Q8R1_9BACT|nr:polyamine ABC transporter ATP-binding protein [candidate division KSB3 bacterium]MBD3327106.1 polyamine ABC transporter ATP-binding protein [candidate division KSB3 bacterium]
MENEGLKDSGVQNPAQRREPVVDLRSVTKQYGHVTAAKDVTFTVSEGEFITLLGPSGSGKTTVLRMIAGFLQPTAGAIFVHGESVSDKAPYERKIGMVFQSLALFPHMDVYGNVSFALKMRRFDPAEIPDRVERILEIVRLPEMRHRKIHQLSGGQQQRVALARALVFEPEVLLLDEPLSALDKKLREDMQLELLRIHQELQITTISVTHDQREALVMSDRIIVMQDGRIAQASSTEDVYFLPKSKFVADFIGETNFFGGRIVSLNSDAVVLQHQQMQIRIPACDHLSLQQEIAVGVRSERISLSRSPDTLDQVDNRYTGRVKEVIFQGDRTAYTIQVEAETIKVVEPNLTNSVTYHKDDEVVVGWNKDDVIVLTA